MKVSNNPDMLAATSHWLYMTLRRLGKDEEAARLLEPIHADMDIIENRSYHELLLLYKGELDPVDLFDGEADAVDDASIGYGLGNWHFYNGRRGMARKVFLGVVRSSYWLIGTQRTRSGAASIMGEPPSKKRPQETGLADHCGEFASVHETADHCPRP